MEYEHNKQGEEVSFFATAKADVWKSLNKPLGHNRVRGRYSKEGVKYAKGLREYYQQKREEFAAQHGPVRIYKGPTTK